MSEVKRSDERRAEQPARRLPPPAGIVAPASGMDMMMTGHLEVPSSALADSLFTSARVRSFERLLMCLAPFPPTELRKKPCPTR